MPMPKCPNANANCNANINNNNDNDSNNNNNDNGDLYCANVSSLGLHKAQGQSVYITIEKQSHIIMQMRLNNMPFSLTLCHFRWHWGVQNTNYDIEINAICSVSVRF